MSTAFTNLQAVPIDAALPAQNTATAGKALISNGTNVGWNTILSMIGAGAGQTSSAAAAAAILPTQTGQSGKYLTTNGNGTLTWSSITFPPNSGVTSVVIDGVSYTGDVTISNVPTATTATNVTGTVAINNGGTGATTAPQALTNLGAAPVNHTHNYAPLASPAFTGAPTAPTPASGDNNTGVATTEFVQTAVNNAALGVGQTWQSLTGSRAFGVTYTNSTAKPIMISVTGWGTDGTQRCEIACAVGGVVVGSLSTTEVDGTFSGYHATMSTIVPAGATYRVYITAGNSSLTSWAELR